MNSNAPLAHSDPPIPRGKQQTRKHRSKLIKLLVNARDLCVCALETITMNKKSIAGILALVAGLSLASTAMAYNFATNLKVGSRGEDVKQLQMVLNMSADTQVSTSGAGAPGMETTYFGNATKAAVIKFQNKYASEVLTPAGLTSGTGFVGAMTRAKLNGTTVTTGTTSTVPGCTSTTGFSPTTGAACSGSTTTAPAGAGVSVAAGTQPANGLAIAEASRVAFTKITLTAGSSDVVVNGIKVQRTGAAVDAAFTGIALLDEDGTQLDIAKTFGSDHTTTVGGTFTVKAGTTKTLTIAGNMQTTGSRGGQVASLSVVAVNTTATVTGALPITGASQTINETLTIGSVTVAVSSYDPNSNPSKEIGTTGFNFAGIRVTAGSAEDVRLKAIRWNQSGSAASGDLANIKTYVDGTAYDTTVSTDGKYYTANFGSGIVLAKGLAKDIYVKGDIIGSGSASRTVKFDIYKATDLYIVGETYSTGITAPVGAGTAAAGTSEFTAVTPWFDGSTINISAGSFTSVTKATSVAAQNIAINLANQVLGGYDADIKGEAISVQSQVFTIATTSGSGTGLLTSVSLYDQNGAVVAGPVDAVYASATTQTVTFTDTVTYPIGKNTYTLKGKVASTINNGVVYTTTFTSMSSITGQTTGNTITTATVGFAMNPMTVKSAAMAVTISSTPAEQIVVAGSSERVFANFQFDASQSGEDVRFSSVATTLAGTAASITTCKLFDGTTLLNSTVPTTANPMTFTFDSPLTVTKGTVKTVALKCNVSASAANNSTYQFGIAVTSSNPTVTGVTSATSVTATGGTITGQVMTVGTSGTLTASAHPSTPTYVVVAAGTTGNTIGVINLRATNENINLTKLGLTLTGSTGSIGQVSIKDGATTVGTVTFTGSVATTTLTIPVVVPKDGDKQLTIVADMGMVGTGQAGVAGQLVKVDYNSAQGTGVDSGTTIEGSGSTAFAGARIQRSFATITYPTTGATAQNGTNDLLALTVTANASGDVQMNKLTFSLATTTATVSTFTFTGPTGNVSSSTPIMNAAGTAVTVYFDSTSNTNDKTIGAGTSKTYTLRGTNVSLTGTSSTGSVTVALKADSAYPTLTGSYLLASTTVSGLTAQNTLWSPISTSSPASLTTGNDDWTNGYGLAGCFATSGLGTDCSGRTISK